MFRLVIILFLNANTFRHVSFNFYIQYVIETGTTPSCSGPFPAQKSQANSAPGAVFPHLLLEMDFNYFYRFSWEKIH